jgi:signal transduction histidine kinase
VRLSRDRLVDLLLGVAVTTVVAVAITADIAGSRPPDVAAYVFAAGLGVLMLARRDFPVPVLALTAVGIVGYHLVDYPPVGLALPAAAALYSTAERDKLWWAIGIGGALLLTSVVGRLREGDDPSYLLGYELASTVMIMAAAIALGDNVRVRRLWRTEQSRREELAEVEREREAARRIESERVRIARELHDVLAHTVAVVSMQADVATEALEDDPGATRDALRTIRTASSDAMRELRSMLGVLRNAPDANSLEPAGSLRNLPKLAELVSESGLPVSVRVEGDPVPVSGLVDTTAYRIVQEALTNALRHAQASRVDVLVAYQPEQLEIGVVDDGRGGDVTSGGQGLVGMRERATLLGGTVSAGNAPAGGFAVNATLPLGSAS